MADVGDETTKKLDHRMGVYHLRWVSNGKNHCLWQSEFLTHKLPWHQICARICPSSGYSIIHPNECLAAAESFLPFLMETSLLAAIQQLENTHRNSPHLGLQEVGKKHKIPWFQSSYSHHLRLWQRPGLEVPRGEKTPSGMDWHHMKSRQKDHLHPSTP